MARVKYLIFMILYVAICISAFNMLIVQQDAILKKYFIEAPRQRIKEYNDALSSSLCKYFIKENRDSSLSQIAEYMTKYAKTSLFELAFMYQDKATKRFLQIRKGGVVPISEDELKLNKEHLYPVTVEGGKTEGYLAVTIADTGAAEYTEGLQRYRIFSYSLRFLFFTLISSLAVIALYHNYSRKMRLARDMAEVKASNDGLTGLYTHAYFERSLEIEIEKCNIYHTPLALAMIDVDRFKGYNDQYGHVMGDKILQEVSRVIKSNTRSTDICARYGGEEFSIIIPSVPSFDETARPKSLDDFAEEVKGVTERIRKSVEQNVIHSAGQSVVVTVSMGVAFYQRDREGLSASELLKLSDAALYSAKDSGRNRITVADETLKGRKEKIT